MKFSCIPALLLVALISSPASAELIKKSHSGLCHTEDSPYYRRTQHFTAYATLQACLDSGGRAVQHTSHTTNQSSDYNRDAFGHWQDDDHDCMNTRQELLQQLSTSPIETNKRHCTVLRGKWLDPYTNRTFYQAHNLDIDHLVPLKWAWSHGANHWNREQRVTFANDLSNLFAVEAGANRSKGDRGPLEWLPPNIQFRCQYVLRFRRLVRKYDLQVAAPESMQLTELQTRVCGTARN